jgi:hypothetical protein
MGRYMLVFQTGRDFYSWILYRHVSICTISVYHFYMFWRHTFVSLVRSILPLLTLHFELAFVIAVLCAFCFVHWLVPLCVLGSMEGIIKAIYINVGSTVWFMMHDIRIRYDICRRLLLIGRIVGWRLDIWRKHGSSVPYSRLIYLYIYNLSMVGCMHF